MCWMTLVNAFLKWDCDLSSAGARVPEEESQLFQAGWSILAHVWDSWSLRDPQLARTPAAKQPGGQMGVRYNICDHRMALLSLSRVGLRFF